LTTLKSSILSERSSLFFWFSFTITLTSAIRSISFHSHYIYNTAFRVVQKYW
jgi:hypothetical protein